MDYTQTITIAKGTEIDTIEKALELVNTSNPVVYIKDGIYSVIRLCSMSKKDTCITWEGMGIDTVIEPLSGVLSSFIGEAIFKRLRIRPDVNMKNYTSGGGTILSYTNDTKKIIFRNVLFDKCSNGIKPTRSFFTLHNNIDTFNSNKHFYNCTFNNGTKMIRGVFGAGLPSSFIKCLYNNGIKDSCSSIVIDSIYDDIDPVTFAPVNYPKTIAGIYSGEYAITEASNVIKDKVFDTLISNKLFQDYCIPLEETNDPNPTIYESVLKTVKAAIEN